MTDRHRRIHEPFLLAALFVALTFGFGYAAVLVEARGHQIPLGAWWIPLVQAHGHAQLFGWMGLFVLGMGLFFCPASRASNCNCRRAPILAFGFWFPEFPCTALLNPRWDSWRRVRH